MPSILNPSLSITGQPASTPLPGDVTLHVTFTIALSPIERFLVDNGLTFTEDVRIIGDDAGVATDAVIHAFPQEVFAPPPGVTEVARSRQLVVGRAALNEDPSVLRALWLGNRQITYSVPDADEILARVDLAPVGLDLTTGAEATASIFVV